MGVSITNFMKIQIEDKIAILYIVVRNVELLG